MKELFAIQSRKAKIRGFDVRRAQYSWIMEIEVSFWSGAQFTAEHKTLTFTHKYLLWLLVSGFFCAKIHPILRRKQVREWFFSSQNIDGPNGIKADGLFTNK